MTTWVERNERVLGLVTEWAYRAWLYLPVVVVISIMISRQIEENRHPDPADPNTVTEGGYSFRIPMLLGFPIPLAEIVTGVTGSMWILARSRRLGFLDTPLLIVFIASQLYMFMPGTILFKTAYGVLVGMPLGAIVISFVLVRLMSVERWTRTTLLAGLWLVTAACSLLTMVVGDKEVHRIASAIALHALGLVALELGYYRHKKSFPKEKVFLLNNEETYGTIE